MVAAMTSIRNDAKSTDLWAIATQKFSVWRNSGLQCFAQAEAAVTDTLLCLSADATRGKDINLRHLFGQRLLDLSSALGPGGAFENIGKSTLKALLAFQMETTLRPFLAHSVAKIAIERDGSWIVVMTHCSFKAKRAENHKLVLDELEAKLNLLVLTAKTQSLCSNLQNLRNKSMSSSKPTPVSL